eukprot:SAG25_NODE_4455_length_811_cov_1.195225_1_plen_39_part_10
MKVGTEIDGPWIVNELPTKQCVILTTNNKTCPRRHPPWG